MGVKEIARPAEPCGLFMHAKYEFPASKTCMFTFLIDKIPFLIKFSFVEYKYIELDINIWYHIRY